MKKLSVLLVLLLLLGVVLSSCAKNTNGQAGKPEYAGIVNGEKIPLWQYDLTLQFNINTYETYYGIQITDDMKDLFMAEIEKNSWRSLIQDSIVLQMAKENGITVTDKDIQKFKDDLIAMYGSEEKFQELLSQNNMTEVQFRDTVIISQSYSKLKEKLTGDISVTEEEASTIYNQDPASWDKVKVSHILINSKGDENSPDDPDTDEKALALAKKIINRLNKGEDFTALAKEYSDDKSAEGGVIDYYFTIKDTQLVKEFVQGSFALKNIGDITQTPVKTQFGYHIIKLDEMRQGFEQLKDDIINLMTENEKAQVFKDSINNRIDEAKVERYITFEYWQEGNDNIPLHRNFFQKIFDAIKGLFKGEETDNDLNDDEVVTDGGGTNTGDEAVTDDGANTGDGAVTDESSKTD